MARIPIYPQNLLNTYMLLFFFLQVLHQHNDTLLRLEAASKSAYSYALGITVGLGGILCFLNGMLLLCLCQKRSSRKRNASQCEPTTSIGNNNYLLLDFQKDTILQNVISKHFFSLSCRLLSLIATSNSSSTFSQFKFITDHHYAQRSKGRRHVDLWIRSAKSIQNFSCYEVCYLRTYIIKTLATLQYPSVVWQITTKKHTRNPILLNTAYSQGVEKDITCRRIYEKFHIVK